MNTWSRRAHSLVFGILGCVVFGASTTVVGAQPAIESSSIASAPSLAVKVAPGEFLPVSVKISNFGGGQRVDVTIKYLINSKTDPEVYTTTDTMAVETSSSLVKSIQIPIDTVPGMYFARTEVVYQGQLAPAISEFSFEVERKLFGLFVSDFIFYAGTTFVFGLLMVVTGFALVKHRIATRFSPIDYSNIPRHERVFYELISDTIMGMRQKVGDRALDIASTVKGLTIDERTGRVVKLTDSPSKIIAELVSGYEKILGRRVSFSFREPHS